MRALSLLLTLAACTDYDLNKSGDDVNDPDQSDTDSTTDEGNTGPQACRVSEYPAESVGVDDQCTVSEGSFTPIVEWDYGDGKGCLALPVVGDLDGDGQPEIVINLISSIMDQSGTMAVIDNTGALVWAATGVDAGYGSSAALGDLDGDGSPEVLIVAEYENSLFADGDYTIIAYDADGDQVWESDHFEGADFDYASSPSISDMDHDGAPEVVVGRVILNSDGTTRGVGAYGRGSYGVSSGGGFTISEASVSAVTDLDLDGTEEVVVGNAIYDPDGNAIWANSSDDDAMVAIANLDSDPEGEIIAITYDTVRAIDTDGTLLWGPKTVSDANIVSTPAICDLDGDGDPEIVVAGGSRVMAYHHDGTVFWSAPATDDSGATGASIFDFEGDGAPEVVYIDEVQMVALDGTDGTLKFRSTEHTSNTMFDYPVIADIDADDQAEILVCHNGYSNAMSVYGDADESWAPARDVWNQHAYSINNVNDDLSIPTTATPAFTDHNTWHAAEATDWDGLGTDLGAEILEVCTDECDQGTVYIVARLRNIGLEDVSDDVALSLYASIDDADVLLDKTTLSESIGSGMSSDAVQFIVDADDLENADAVWVGADDDGTGTGAFDECSETNNDGWFSGPFCG